MIDDDVITRLVDLHDHIEAPVTSPGADVARGRRMLRRRRAVVAGAASAAVTAVLVSVAAVGTRGGDARPVGPDYPEPDPRTNGWVAVDIRDDIYVVRPGEAPQRLEIAGPEGTSAFCPAWSPDGTRLLWGRHRGTWESPSGDAELVVVPIGRNGAAGTPSVITLDDFPLPEAGSYGPRPCATWAPDGRWVAFVGSGDVWVVDTSTGTTRRLPGLWPSDLAWRPGTDELAIAGDVGSDPDGRRLATPISIYSVSTGEVQQLGSVEAANITWSPDGATLAYTGGEDPPYELRLVDADGSDVRLLDGFMGAALYGIGPEWSPRGDYIVFQRAVRAGGASDVVLVDPTDGTRVVIDPPAVDAGRTWYPRNVSWSPDGTTLLYAGWFELDSQVGDAGSGVIAVPVDDPARATLLIEGDSPASAEHNWGPHQMWGSVPE